MILVSVIVPVYNMAKYLNECIESVVSQTYTGLEIIVVDDGSTDGSSELCDAWLTRDERIKVIHQTNGGLSFARNTGMAVSRGEYMLFLDSDDVLESETIERFMSIATKYKVSVVTADLNAIRANGEPIENPTYDFFKRNRIISVKEYWESQMISEASTTITGKLFLKKIWEGIEFPVGKINEDVAVLPDIIKEGNEIAVCSYNSYRRRLHSESIMGAAVSYKRMDAIRIYDKAMAYLISIDCMNVAVFYAQLGMRVIGDVYDACDMSDEQKKTFSEDVRLFKKRVSQVMKNKYLSKVGMQAIVFLISVPAYSLLHQNAKAKLKKQ